MKYAVFFRNTNLGHSGSPSKAQLEEAFIKAGAINAASFLTNGTVVFSVKEKSEVSNIFASASIQLRAISGLVEPGFIRPVTNLSELVQLNPFKAVDISLVYQCCITFLPVGCPAIPELPLESKRKDVEAIHITHGEFLSVSRKIGNTVGSPNAFLEKLLGVSTTTRNWNTILRLVQKHA